MDEEVTKNEIVEDEVIDEVTTNETDDQENPELIQDDDFVVTIGEEEPDEEEVQKAPGWVKSVRKQNREQAKKIKELERQLKTTTENPPVELKEKPTLSGCDYDDAVYEKKLAEWYDHKAKYDAQQTEKERLESEQKATWNRKIERFTESKVKLDAEDFEEVESVVTDSLSQTQLGIIMQGADDSALLVYALGKNPKKAEELAKIKDPVEFAFRVAKLEAQLKVSGRQQKPAPEKVIKSTSSGIGGSVDSTLERLRTEAAKTGDYTKVTAYKKKLREKNHG